MSRYLETNPAADQLNQRGVDLSKAHDFSLAREAFAEAQHVLDDSPGSIGKTVQSAGITRNDGFTFVREGLQTNNLDLIIKAGGHTLAMAETATAPLAIGTDRFHKVGAKRPGFKPRKARREIYAEHGATLNLMGRLATAAQVVHRTEDPRLYNAYEMSVHRDVNQRGYREAHPLLAMGNNGYYRVVNAMTAARQERLNDSRPDMVTWLAKAAVGFIWTVVHDRTNAKDAFRALGRVKHLRNYETALESVRTHP